MFDRVKDQYALRGWEGMSGALLRKPTNLVEPLSQQAFNLLLLCDGETDVSSLPLSGEERETLENLVERGIVERLQTPRPLDDWQRYWQYPNRYMQTGFWSMTGRCNYRCRHCFMDAPEGAMGELTHEEAMELVEQMAQCGILRVDLTGGEPFVRRDFWQILDSMLAHQMVIGTVYTNGWLLTEQVLDEFDRRNIKPEFSISFDGLGWHDWMRGVEGAEKAALDALARCIRRGFPVDVEMCLHRGNLGVFRESIRRLAQIGVPAVKCSRVSDSSLWKCHSEGNELSYREYVEAMIDFIPAFYEDGAPLQLLMCDVIDMAPGSGHYQIVALRYDGMEDSMQCHLCGAARKALYLAPDGRMLPCMPMTACKEQAMFPRFQDVGLREGLSDSLYMQFIDRRVCDLQRENARCAACEHLKVCGGGYRASALEQSGDLMGCDANQCFLWENGYVEKIRQAADRAIEQYLSKGKA